MWKHLAKCKRKKDLNSLSTKCHVAHVKDIAQARLSWIPAHCTLWEHLIITLISRLIILCLEEDFHT